MKRRVFWPLAVGFLLGLLVGGYAAWYMRWRFSALGDLAALAWSSERSQYLYLHGKPTEAREALRYNLSILERARRANEADQDSTIDFDMALAYGRLAGLESSAGDATLAREYLVKGAECLARSGVPESSPEKLERVVAIMDRRR
jgi:hypothetical protein